MTRARVSTRALAAGMLVVALLLGGVVSYYAAGAPDGLSKVAQDQGFADTETATEVADGPFAGYDAGFLEGERLSGGVAGVVGVLVVLVLAGGLALVVRRRDRPGAEPAAAGTSRTPGVTDSTDSTDAADAGSR